MKIYQIYECEKCGMKSETYDEIVACEANHLDITVEERFRYIDLQEMVKIRSHIASRKNNDETRRDLDLIVEELIRFEKEHNIIS